MGSLLVQVAIYGLAAAFAAPIAIVVTALILGKSARPVLGAWTFVAGAAFLDIVFAAVILAADLFEEGGDAGAIVDVGLGVLFVAMGLLAVFQAESPEKDAARRARAEQIATAKLATVPRRDPRAGDQLRRDRGLRRRTQGHRRGGPHDRREVFATVFGLAIMLSVYYVPVLIYMIAPKKAVPLLGRMTEWIMANSRMLEIVVGLGFGVYFLAKGLAVLL